MGKVNQKSSRWQRFLDNDIVYSFLTTPGAMIAATITLIAITATFAAPLIAPYNPFDPAQISLWDGKLPPAWTDGGSSAYLLGTDNQGRDMLSTILYGGRISILVGIAAVFLGMLLGVTLGVISGYFGGLTDTIIMRIADVQLTIPGILVAILINGIGRATLPLELREEFAIYVVIVAIGLTDWPQFARVARGATLVEAEKEYVQAAKLIGLPKFTIILRHILPNTLRPVLVIATIGLALAIIAEATLSFLGQGIPPTTPSLGTLIRVGNEFLFSGLWWITFFPAIALIILVFSVNLLGDWMRDALNPKLR
jgi:peptide/nickel transport system permease protein|tara:strand:+ start:4590 stop:5522 length:933 start_codon:yes stop_codon:yes gene_type:complete